MKNDKSEIISAASKEWRSFIEPMASIGERVISQKQYNFLSSAINYAHFN